MSIVNKTQAKANQERLKQKKQSIASTGNAIKYQKKTYDEVRTSREELKKKQDTAKNSTEKELYAQEQRWLDRNIGKFQTYRSSLRDPSTLKAYMGSLTSQLEKRRNEGAASSELEEIQKKIDSAKAEYDESYKSYSSKMYSLYKDKSYQEIQEEMDKLGEGEKKNWLKENAHMLPGWNKTATFRDIQSVAETIQDEDEKKRFLENSSTAPGWRNSIRDVDTLARELSTLTDQLNRQRAMNNEAHRRMLGGMGLPEWMLNHAEAPDGDSEKALAAQIAKLQEEYDWSKYFKDQEVMENIDDYVAKAEKAYNDYTHTVAYQAKQSAKQRAREKANTFDGMSYEESWDPDIWEGDTKEEELRRNLEYYKNIQAYKKDQELMAADMQELAKWSKEEQRMLAQYAADLDKDYHGKFGIDAYSMHDFRHIGEDSKGNTYVYSTLAEKNAAPLIEKYGKKKVDEIAESYKRNWNQQTTQDISAKSQALASESFLAGAGHSLLSVGANFVGSISSPLGYAAEFTQRTGRYSTLDPNNVGMLPGTYASSVRQTVGDNIRKWGGDAGATVYDAGMSALDNLTRIVLTGGGAGSLALAATGSFGQTISSLSQQGVEPMKAVGMGIINGGLEILTEKISLDNLLADLGTSKDLTETLWKMIRAGGVEVTEEELSFLGSTLAEALVLREDSSYNRRIAELQFYGLPEGMAKEQAARGVIDEAFETALQSFLSGGMMEGATSLYYNAKNSNLYSNTVNRIQDKAAEFQRRKRDKKPEKKNNTVEESVDPATVLEQEKNNVREILQSVTKENVDIDDIARTRMQAQAAVRRGSITDNEYYQINQYLERAEELADANAPNLVAAQKTVDPEMESLRQTMVEEREQWNQAEAVLSDQGQAAVENDQQVQAEALPENPKQISPVKETVEPARNSDEPTSIAEEIRQEQKLNGGTDNVITEQKTAGTDVLDESTQRTHGENTGKQSGGLEKGTVWEKAGKLAAAKRKTDRQSVARNLRKEGRIQKISSRELGLNQGTDSKNIEIFPQDAWDGELQEVAERINEETGREVVFVLGQIKIQNSTGQLGSVGGVYMSDKIIVRADHPELTATQLADHEEYHAIAADAPGLNERIREHIENNFSEDEFAETLNKYFDAYYGIYGADPQSENQLAEIWDRVIEEVFADAYAGINSFGRNVKQYHEAVNALVEDALYPNGRKNQENGTKKTNAPPQEQYSVSNTYADEIEQWDRSGRSEGEVFILGSTGDVLQGLGAIESDIYVNGDKVTKILKDHPEMTIDTIKRIPEILDDPVLILKSRNAAGNRQNTRLVIFGSVKAQNGKPVLCALDMRPVEKGLVIDDMQKVTSAYTKTSNPVQFIRNSEVLHADKKRTAPLLRTIGFHVPMELQRSGSIGSISYDRQNVNIQGVPFEKVFSEKYETFQEHIERQWRERYSVSYDPEEPNADLTAAEDVQTNIRKGERAISEDATLRNKKREQEKNERRKQQEAAEREVDRMRGINADGSEESVIDEELFEKPKKKKRRIRKKIYPVAESKPITAKHRLRQGICDLFSVSAGRKAEIGQVVDQFADKLLKRGQLTEQERAEFFNRMFEEGIVEVAADQYTAMGRDIINGGRVYVDDVVRGELGDDWQNLRRRAFGAGVILTNDKSDAGIDQWNHELASYLPGLFDSEQTDMTAALEWIIGVAEEGRVKQMSLADYTAQLAGEFHVSEQELINSLEEKMDILLRVFAESASLEIKLRDRTGIKIAQERQRSRERLNKRMLDEERRYREAQQARRQRRQEQAERKQLKELQEKVQRQLKWLNKNRHKAPEELQKTIDEVLGDIDIYAIGHIDEWSVVDGDTVNNIVRMYESAKESDPNFLPSTELERLVSRLNGIKLSDMTLDQLNDLYRAAVAVRTEYYNRRNILDEKQNRLIAEVLDDSIAEINDAPGQYTGKFSDRFLNLDQLTPMNVIQRMVGWNPDSTFYSMAKQLEKGERDMRAYTVKANRMLEEFLTENQEWVKKADGQGKDAIWYDIEVHELVGLKMGDKPVFAKKPTKISMTPAQKVHMYLESKNYANLRHMAGGRTFVNKELYSEGKRKEALAQGTTVRLAPETVKKIVSDMTEEELELARILEQYYNGFAKQEINKVSNILYGYDKAMGNNYAPIICDDNYTFNEIEGFDRASDDIRTIKERIEGSKNPSFNISAFDAFERHVSSTGRFCGMAVPTRNWNKLMKWSLDGKTMKSTIAHKWGEESSEYITSLIKTLQGKEQKAGGRFHKLITEDKVEDITSNYISAVFGANPSIVLKQLGSIPLASSYMGWRNAPTVGQLREIDRTLIAKYTQELDWRTMGYSMPETKQLKDNPNWTETNKYANFWLGGGAITAMDGWAASTLWPWAENKVRNEYPDLEIGTREQIESGQSPFYKKVAEEFNDAVSRSQSVSDEIHQSELRKNKNLFAKALTMFRSDSAQTYNTIRQKVGETQFYAKQLNGIERQHADGKISDELYERQKEETGKKLRTGKKAVGATVTAVLLNSVWAEAINFLMNLWKYKGSAYRDDDDELTAGSVLSEMAVGVVNSFAGIVAGGEELAEAIGAAITGEGVEGVVSSLTLDQFNEMLGTFFDAGADIRDVIADAWDIGKKGGNVAEYLKQHSNEIAGCAKEVAKTVAMYFGGVPVGNVEAYLLGALKHFLPGLATEYEDVFKKVQKSGLSNLTGDALEARVGNILQKRKLSEKDATTQILSNLYENEHVDAVPKNSPDSLTVDETKIEMDAYNKQMYEAVWNSTVATDLDALVESGAFKNAQLELQEKMIKYLYSYADEKAKLEVAKANGIEYTVNGTASDFDTLLGEGLSFADVAEAKAQWSVIDAQYEDATSKATAYSYWVSKQGYSSSQETAIKENFTYMQMFPAAAERYEKFTEYGLTEEDSLRLNDAISALEPEEGKSQVSWLQKIQAVDRMNLNQEDQYKALIAVTPSNYTSTIKKLDICEQLGISAEKYIALKSVQKDFDADGDGETSQKEIEDALDNLGGAKDTYALMTGVAKPLSNREKAILWQIQNVTWKAKYNPYDKQVGQQVYELLHEE